MRPFLGLTLVGAILSIASAFRAGSGRRVASFSSRRTTSTATCLHAVTSKKYKHALAILAMPYTSMDRIANEAVLETVLPTTRKLSVVLRCENARAPETATLRRYVGEIYSQLWDCALAADSAERQQNPELPDVVVYPQNLPNLPPESWIDIAPDLEAVCSHDFITGWTSESVGRGKQFETVAGNGVGGLDEHVAALNSERRQRNLPPVVPLHVVTGCPNILAEHDDQVVFLDDDEERPSDDDDDGGGGGFLAGARPSSKDNLYNSVCVGGTFDGLHFGHRKLLTLAVSSVNPVSGKLLVGVTVDEMLRKKTFADYIPKFEERCAGVRTFLHRLAPGMINRIHITAISDAFGPPGQKTATDNDFDALVLSHETLETGRLLNQHRVQELGLKPLKLLCTRRTESHGMSSTALRRLRNQIKEGQRVV